MFWDLIIILYPNHFVQCVINQLLINTNSNLCTICRDFRLETRDESKTHPENKHSSIVRTHLCVCVCVPLHGVQPTYKYIMPEISWKVRVCDEYDDDFAHTPHKYGD